ncbi:DUF3857 domain-containing protein [Fulvivirga sp. M361]|uniref:DUF3858 domain-containing protein n=1 Tax=Fulvivirga sp. M361 TaxID=2594266 RepID=UPI001179A57C|nr:DUF3858 domain-containing protein [Fulvivirga sp. M361]TRX51408.1 DUF3857 domain-containing protein [Fulvivirga sp. M361]
MKTSPLFPALFFVLITSFSYAQKWPFKFGKVTEEEMQLEKCEFYPEAKSMVLGEYGDLSFYYTDDHGWKYEMEVTVRKKIFKITDGDQANVKISLYEPVKGSAKEEITGIKSYTYNEVDGKIEREKLDNSEYYTKRISDYWVEISFAIPNVKEGSVIEYTYRKTSDYLYNLTTWYFQSDIPTAHSEFRFTIPEYFNYQASQLGNVYLGENENKTKPEKFTYKWEVQEAMGNVRKGTGTLESNSKWRRMVLRNIPPIEDEPFMNNRSDVPSRLEFQLMSTNFPNSVMKVVAGSYQKFNNELLTSSSFGDRLKNGNFVKSLENSLQGKSPLEKGQSIYTHISKHFDWNKSYNFMSSQAGRPAYNKKSGNVADINLTLVAALREFDLQAFPVILSTRGHGTAHPIYPSYDDFNYVIAVIIVDGKLITCDATSGLPFGQLPLKCRNGNGWLVNDGGGKWLDLKANSKYVETTVIKTEIKEGELVTHVQQREADYAAHSFLRKIRNSSEEEYSKTISAAFSDAEVKNFHVSEIDLSQPVEIEYDVVREGNDADVIYIQPIITGSIQSCPFTRESRTSHIDFPYTQSRRVLAQITIPEGYQAELPEAAIYKLPDGAGAFIFNVQQQGDQVHVVSTLTIKKTMFSTEEYTSLKRFYEMVSNKNQELIVLSR